MVQWKGDIEQEKSGGRAARLDSIESLQVPNFFTITREESEKIVGDSRNTEEIIDREFPEELYSEIKDAYSDINVSSEVRNASGRARNLVEGQRNGGKVSVRISGQRKGVYDYKINVGASSLKESIKEVLASYYSAESNHDYPAIIVQRMVDSEISGAAMNSYLGQYGLVEAVKGLGTSLEEGITTPDRYLLQDGSVVESEYPEEQVKVSINPMSGSQKKKTEKRRKSLLRKSEVSKLHDKISQEGLDIKFVYKRGTFYIVDAFEPENGNPFSSTDSNLKGIRVSNGEIEGVVGENIRLSGETLPPEQYSKALIARKGGYTSTHAQLARNKSKPAIFSFTGEIENGQKMEIDSRKVEPEKVSQHQDEQRTRHSQDSRRRKETRASDAGDVAATEVVPINAGDGLYLSPPFRGRYAITDQEIPGNIPTSSYFKSYADVFKFEGDEAVLDARRLEHEGLEKAMEYLEADLKIILIGRNQTGLVRKAVEEGFDVMATERDVEGLKNIVMREEKRFILDRLREQNPDQESH